MTNAELMELIAALRQGNASREVQQLAADLLEPRKRGGQRMKLRDLIIPECERVDRLAAQLGTKERAFAHIAEEDGVTPESVKRRYYRYTKRWFAVALGYDIE